MPCFRARSLVLIALILGVSACDDSSPPRRPVQYPPQGQPQGQWGPAPQPGPAPSGPPLRPDEISQVVNASYPSFTQCYMKSESYMLGKSGNVTIFFDVAPTGNVTRATDQAPPGVAVGGSPLADPKLVACLSQSFFALRFRQASEETAASWMFTFSP
jgi:hypothetical protein